MATPAAFDYLRRHCIQIKGRGVSARTHIHVRRIAVPLCPVCKIPMKEKLSTPRTTTYRCDECGTLKALPTASVKARRQ